MEGGKGVFVINSGTRNSTFPPCILSLEPKYRVNLPSVMNKTREKFFFIENKIF